MTISSTPAAAAAAAAVTTSRELRRRGKTDYSSLFDSSSSSQTNNNSNATTTSGREAVVPLQPPPSFDDSRRRRTRGISGGDNDDYDGFESHNDSTTTTTVTSWIVTKFVILRMIGIIYFIGFLGAYYQNQGLFGEYGLQPATNYFEKTIRNQYSTSSNNSNNTWWQGFLNYPSIFWWITMTDERLNCLYLFGMILSSLVVVVGEEKNSMILMFILWILYFTVITTASIVSSSFYGYGWESQLLETGFLGIFLCDGIIFSNSSSNNKQQQLPQQQPKPPSPIILWLFRWLCFRISMGAGLIKIRGDSCWTTKTCLWYHFETQPIPSPTSFIFHFLPKSILSMAVDLDLVVQVYTSWFVLLPTTIYYIPPRFKRLVSKLMLMIVRLGGFIQIGFMMNIVLSGNFAFLNHLTIIPALACLDDSCWPQFIHSLASSSTSTTTNTSSTNDDDDDDDTNKRSNIIGTTPTSIAALPLSSFKQQQQQDNNKQYSWSRTSKIRVILDIVYFVVVIYLSQPVMSNLLQLDGRRQAMNTSYDKFHLVNTYGAFGSVGKGRYEPIVSISYDGINWMEIEFPCKPGKLNRRPCFCAPYHYRVDWNIWFIGFKPHIQMLQGREGWLFSLLAKLLDRNAKHRPWLDLLDSQTAKLLRDNYERKFLIPRYAKVDMYHYSMAAPLWEIIPNYFRHQQQDIIWWNRTFEEVLIPIVEFDQKNQRLVSVERSSRQ